MASRKQHCEETLVKLGRDWDEVHGWLDGLACVSGMLNINHSRYRHHTQGIEEVRKMYGDEAALAAEIHIKRDFGGYVPSKEEVESWFSEELELISFESLRNG